MDNSVVTKIKMKRVGKELVQTPHHFPFAVFCPAAFQKGAQRGGHSGVFYPGLSVSNGLIFFSLVVDHGDKPDGENIFPDDFSLFLL